MVKTFEGGMIWATLQLNAYNIKVRELVDNDTRNWKTDLVNLYYDQHVENQILYMPIFKDMGEDKCSWKFTSHGEYNVKTTYHYIMEILLDNSDL